MFPKPSPTQHRSGRAHWLLVSITLILLGLVTAISLTQTSAALAEPTTPDLVLQNLLDKANEAGTVRVIVGLDVSFVPEGDLAGAQAVLDQRQAIAAAQDQVWQQLAAENNSLIANFKYIPAMAVSVDAAGLEKLAGLPQVSAIQEDKLSAPTLASSIPVIGADDAWTAGYTGGGQAVAILDTGVDKTHSFFSGGKVVSEACYSSNGSDIFNGRYSSVCPGGVTETTASGSGIDCVAAAAAFPGAQTDCRHGTHVAGIAAGNGGGTSNVGVAPDANIIAVQVFTLFEDFDHAFTWDSDQIKGLMRVYELRNTFDIAAVNMSLGGSTLYSSACNGDSRKAAVDLLESVEIATIIATGNAGSTTGISAPACISSAISVGSTTDSDVVSSFSNVASIMDFYAPGSNITSSIPGGSTATYNGTSMATPHVAGAWAVVKSFLPNATIAEVSAALKDTGTLIDDTRSGGTVMNIPRINVFDALQSFAPTATDDGFPTPLDTETVFDVLANDPNNESLIIFNVTTPTHGTAVITSDEKKIRYTPETGYSGVDSFDYTIQNTDNGLEDTGRVTIIVDPETTFLPLVMK